MQYDKEEVAKAIRELCAEKGLSQEVISGFAGIARSHLSMIETGSKQPNLETIWKIAIACGMKPSELVARIENACNSDRQRYCLWRSFYMSSALRGSYFLAAKNREKDRKERGGFLFAALPRFSLSYKEKWDNLPHPR